MEDWRERIRMQMELGKEIGRRKRLEHNKKVKDFFGKFKKKKEETKED